MKKQIIALTAISALIVGAASQVSAAEATYTVEKGDTLWSIAKNNEVSVGDLQKWNDLESSLILPSQELKLEEDYKKYTVVKGDTLIDIALENDISLNELMTWNELTDSLIIPGQELYVEGEKVKGASTVAAKASSNANSNANATATTASTASKASTTSSSPSAANQAGQTITVSATAYTAFCSGCSGVTATGIDLRANPNMKVIAVDPNVIPLGSRVWVEGYGEAIAGDTGGAIKGNKIDVFIADKGAALNWGRKTISVKILD
ncbi:3D domain-containing protein [Paenisporosarcina cavernae]|uniref:LysM peptidoglycan-binding domain-containing protein n=1 Tax=Paenisporosarcina cavernae TaxID=2320858 RepID=A0A385YY43_9BACL|nr:3D domain-containing protein [Paenisporosarcina cavernae]AYC30463.1 LysM peptidoglycan-binding domain-containing protein [Paenisporosarcina cavernae]